MNQGMVVAPQPEAVEAGVLILREGGNAVDAGIVCGLVQGVVDPQMTGIAGFGSFQGVNASVFVSQGHWPWNPKSSLPTRLFPL